MKYVLPTVLCVSICIGVLIEEGDILICVMLPAYVTFGHELLKPVMVFNFHSIVYVI